MANRIVFIIYSMGKIMDKQITIMVVEDDTNINNLLKTALEKAGYKVLQAFS